MYYAQLEYARPPIPLIILNTLYDKAYTSVQLALALELLISKRALSILEKLQVPDG